MFLFLLLLTIPHYENRSIKKAEMFSEPKRINYTSNVIINVGYKTVYINMVEEEQLFTENCTNGWY